MTDLDELLRAGAASWLLSAARRDLARRTRDGLAWPSQARAVVDELARLADQPAPPGMSASGHEGRRVIDVAGFASVAEAARLVCRDPRHVRRLVRTGRVRGLRVDGRTWLVNVESLQDVLRRAS